MQNNLSKKDPLGSGWMIIAALAFTLMNIWVKEAGNRFELGSGELVFWRMSFAALVLGMLAKAQGKTFFTPHWRAHLSRSVSGTLGMFCIFYAVVHLPLATGVTLSYTSSIFLALLSIIVLREKLSGYKQIMLVLGFAGVVVLLRPSVGGGQEWPALVGLLGGFFCRLGLYAGARIVAYGRAGLAGGVLFIAGGHGNECAVGNGHGLAQLELAGGALFVWHRRIGAGGAALPHARL